MTEKISHYEETIDNLSCHSTEGCGNIPWPVGVPPPFKPPTRFDVLRWDYFNETHIFLKTDHDVINEMEGSNAMKSLRFSSLNVCSLLENDYADVHEVIDHSVQRLRDKYGTE